MKMIAMVEATAKGKRLARKAEDLLGTPPPALTDLSSRDLEALNGILDRLIPPTRQESS